MGRSRLVAEPIVCAQTRHTLAPSKVSAPFVRLGRVLIPAYLKFVLAFDGIELRSPEAMLSELRDFQAHKSRLIVALRHP